MDALEQPFDHDAIVSLRKIIVRRDDLQSAGAIFFGVEINLLSEKRDVGRRDIAADQPRGRRALVPGGQPILAGIRADISRESCLANAAFEICYRERS